VTSEKTDKYELQGIVSLDFTVNPNA
jgi:hypothetical protein